MLLKRGYADPAYRIQKALVLLALGNIDFKNSGDGIGYILLRDCGTQTLAQ
jgi:hypothetical protein